MKTIEKQATLRKLTPDEGMWLTEVNAPEFIENTVLCKEVYLAVNDDAARYKEITDAEKIEIENQIKKIIEERNKKQEDK